MDHFVMDHFMWDLIYREKSEYAANMAVPHFTFASS
jgi:hypothetical protein